MPRDGRKQPLHGRARECDTLRSLIADVQSGRGQAIVLRGEAGVGKSALLSFASDHAARLRCIEVTGVESDMELAYAGLHQLCSPLMKHHHELPPPQREALSVAFGLGVGPPPDRFLVGLAVLSLLAAAAGELPLLCLVDDAQWLDEVSTQILGFVARRLVAEPIGLIFAVRDTADDLLTGVPELTIGGLSDTDARALLDSVMPGGIDPRVRDRVVAETRGNPLAVLVVPKHFTSSELAGGYWNVGAHSTPGRIEEGFIRRIRALPESTRQLLLLAAAEPVGDSALFLRAAAALGIAADALGPAEAAGVIEFGPRMRFYHPMMRSAAYRAAELSERRRIHGVLAEATDAQSDPDRRAWHAANAAVGPDDSVAAQLEASAERAQSRGGLAAAAAFLERSAILSADAAARGRRALAAAQAKRDVAAPAAAYELLAIAETAPLSPLHRASAIRLRAQLEFAGGRAGAAGGGEVGATSAVLLDAARQLEGLDDFAARETYLEAIAADIIAGRSARPGALADAAAAAQSALTRSPDRPRAVDLLLEGVAERFTAGPRDGARPLRVAMAAMCDLAQSDESAVLRWLVPAFPLLQESAAHELWDDAPAHQLSTAVVRQARRAGALAGLPQALVYQAGAHLLAGEFGTAARLIEEADSIAGATSHSTPVRYHAVLLAAWRGDAQEAAAVIEGARQRGLATGEGRLLGLADYAAAVLYNGLGRYQEALAVARAGCSFEDPGIYAWCLFELIEAATHVGATDAVAAEVRSFEERAAAGGTDWGLGALAGARALLADNDEADALFTEAVQRLERTRVAVHLARTHLSYGEWLRRGNRRIDARHHLSAAHEMFSRMGAQAYADRTRRELTALGDKVRKQPVSSGDDLTAQEDQIARLAADGLTNQEIGAQLFISTHTVEWHLRKVFVKLGITSRRQLRTISWAS